MLLLNRYINDLALRIARPKRALLVQLPCGTAWRGRRRVKGVSRGEEKSTGGVKQRRVVRVVLACSCTCKGKRRLSASDPKTLVHLMPVRSPPPLLPPRLLV